MDIICEIRIFLEVSHEAEIGGSFYTWLSKWRWNLSVTPITNII